MRYKRGVDDGADDAVQGYIPITMSTSQKRIIANAHLFDFELTKEEINTLDGLDEG